MTQKVILGLLLTTLTVSVGLNTSITYADQNTLSHPRILKSSSELDYPPFALVRPDGSADGFSVELLKAVVQEIGMEVEIPVGPWHEIKLKLSGGGLDVLPLVAYSADRDKLFDFTVPYLQMHGTIFVRKGEQSIHSEAALKDKEVLVMRDDASHEYAIRENLPVKLILTDTFEEAFTTLSAGKHDAILCQHLMGLRLIKKLGISNVVSVSSKQVVSLKPSGGEISRFKQKFCFAVQDGNKELLTRLNEGMAIVFANGTYERLYIKWFTPILPKPPVSPTQVIKYLLFILIPILLFVGIIGLLYLRKEVSRKTKDLMMEIEERKQVEERLQKNEERFDLAVRLTLDGIWDWNILTNEEYYSPRWCEIIGYSHDDSELPHTYDFWSSRIHPDDYERVMDAIKAHLEEGKPYDVDYQHRHKSGEYRWQNSQGQAFFDESDKPIRMVGCIRDITERKQAEEEKAKLEDKLQQAYKMEAIGTLAGGIAHDFNNILGIIRGFADLALDYTSEVSPAKSYINKILKASGRAKDLVTQILLFSRQETQNLSPLQPGSLIKESIKLLRSTIPTTIKIQQDIESQCGIINADPTQIHQVLMNLVTNAMHAMDEKGVLTVALKQVSLDEEAIHKPDLLPGTYVCLSVSDTGVGIDRETIDRIFDPFFTTKEIGEGTGMGLSVVHGIVESHGGMITVDSEPGKGTTFNVFFPVVESGVEQVSEKSESLPTGSERILFIDDEVDMAEMGVIMLESLGYKVTAISSSNVALETFISDSDEFDLVITDQSMPDMSGAELAVELLKVRPDIPIILCTGFSRKISDERAKEIGAREFLMKPLDRKQLAMAVRKVLDEDKT